MEKIEIICIFAQINTKKRKMKRIFNTIGMLLVMGMVAMADIVKSNEGGTDARTFGLKGNVGKVITTPYFATPGEDGLVQGEKMDGSESEMAFDWQGRVLRDLYGNVYVYDEAGNFIKGEEDYQKMKRDGQGRIVLYESRRDDEDDTCFTMEFTYDSKGRVSKMNLSLWEGSYTDELVYQGDNVYPDKIINNGSEQGEDTKMTTQYRYLDFDEQGNWLKREVHVTVVTTEETGDSSAPVPTKEEIYTIEEREIKYY